MDRISSFRQLVKRRWFGLLVVAGALSPAGLSAHTIPVSYLTIVPDKDFVHVELVLNPFELNFFSEIDANRNGRLDREEVARFEEVGTRQLVDAIQLSVGGKVIRAEVAGASLAVDSHHLILRAHYRVDARQTPLSVRCSLARITRGGHATSVKYINRGRRQSAFLETEESGANFDPASPDAKPEVEAR